MRTRPPVLVGAVTAIAAGLALPAHPAGAVPEAGPEAPLVATGWYLALGDSLANGF